MSTLSSSSTDAQVFAAYDDNASYAEDASVTKAKAFITACRFLLRRMPKMASTPISSMQLTPDLIQAEMRGAQEYVDNNDEEEDSSAGPKVTRANFNNFRS